MSSAAAAVARPIEAVTRPVTNVIEGGLEAIGVSDPSTRGGISGALSGTLGNPFAPISTLSGIQRGNEIERQRDLALAAQENQRLAFNQNVFSLAQGLRGQIADNTDFDFEQLNFAGSDPREQELQSLINVFQQRRQEVLQSQFQPGSSQTRLSLLG